MSKKEKLDDSEPHTNEEPLETIDPFNSPNDDAIQDVDSQPVSPDNPEDQFEQITQDNWDDNPFAQHDQASSSDTDEYQPEFTDVRSHYANPKLNTTRENSTILQLRHLNNTIKTLLINKYTIPGDRYLDLGAGRGGDLNKVGYNLVKHVTFVDITKESLMELEDRLLSNSRLNITYKIVEDSICNPDMLLNIQRTEEKSKGRPPPSAYSTVDTTNTDNNILREDDKYDIASCQFCFNYICSSEDNVHIFFKNISHLIVNNGYVIMTFTDTEVLAAKYKSSKGGLIKNKYYSIKFAEDNEDESCFYSKFGIKYKFSLVESVEELDEYIVPFERIIEIGLEYGLQVVEDKNFTNFLVEQLLENKRKLNWKINRMKQYLENNLAQRWMVDENNDDEEYAEKLDNQESDTKVDKDIWDVFYIYKICVFKKCN